MNSKISYLTIYKQKCMVSNQNLLLWFFKGNGKLSNSNFELDIYSDQIMYLPAYSKFDIKTNVGINAIIVQIDSSLEDAKCGYYDVGDILKYFLSNYILSDEKELLYQGDTSDDKLITLMKQHSTKITLHETLDDLRVRGILNYLNENYNNRIKMDDIGAQFYINKDYLSNLFKKSTNYTISSYLKILRLENAANQIINTSDQINKVLLDNGFADYRIFNRQFWKYFACSPSSLRHNKQTAYLQVSIINYSQQLLSKYFAKERSSHQDNIDIIIDIKQQSIKHLDTSINCFAISRAADILRADIQQQIIYAKKRINFKYCTFHNIFGDEMNVISKTDSGVYKIVMTNVIKVCDFLVDQEIIPFIELGYFPHQIADSYIGPFTGYQLNTGGKINFDLWQKLVEIFFEVINNRYKNIEKWKFNFFSDVDFPSFWPNSYKDLTKLYRITYDIAKKCNKQFSIGGFGFANLTKDTRIIEMMIANVQYTCNLDFISIHSYPFIVEDEHINEINNYNRIVDVKTKYQSNKLASDLHKLNMIIDKYNIKKAYVSAWNSLLAKGDALNDSLYKAASIIRDFISINISDDHIAGICYWSLSDLVNEHGLDEKEFHGGLGLISNNGIAKPAFRAFELINELKGEIIYINPNVIISKARGSFYCLAHNCVEIIMGKCSNEHGLLVEEQKMLTIKFTIDLPEGEYLITEKHVSNNTNPQISSKLIEKNCNLSYDEISYLKRKSEIIEGKKVKFLSESWKMQHNLKENEIYFLKLEKR